MTIAMRLRPSRAGERLLASDGPAADLSRIDWMICKDMATKDLSHARSQASLKLPARQSV